MRSPILWENTRRMESSHLKSDSARKTLVKALVAVRYGVFFRRKGTTKIPTSPKRILLLNGLHVGDIVIATSVLPVLRAAYPSAEIGFLTGSWSRMVVANHPDVRYTHCVDHWMTNRSPKSLLQKVRQYRQMRAVALGEIRALQYDLAISLFTNFPDFLDLSWTARIPVRIGFSRSIYSALATHLVHEPESLFVHQGERLGETLRALPIDPALFRLRHSTLPPSSEAAIQEVCSLFEVHSLDQVRYRVVHIGSGAVCRELPVTFWRELVEKLAPSCTLLFTGRGAREAENIAAVLEGQPNCVNACDRLSWDGFVAAVRHAELLYGVESMAGHVAGAVGTPCRVVYGGTAGVARWRPEGEGSIVMTQHVPCAPCFWGQGCAAMTCTRHFSAHDLVTLDHSSLTQD